MTTRICPNGHTVTDEHLKYCPECDQSLFGARAAMSPLAADAASGDPSRLPGPNRSWNLAMFGTALSIGGGAALVFGSSDGATFAGVLLLAFGQFLVLVGAIGIGVFHGLLDMDERKRAEKKLIDGYRD